jgi:hypothetical protein
MKNYIHGTVSASQGRNIEKKHHEDIGAYLIRRQERLLRTGTHEQKLYATEWLEARQANEAKKAMIMNKLLRR